jgi:hypothetical protein
MGFEALDRFEIAPSAISFRYPPTRDIERLLPLLLQLRQ